MSSTAHSAASANSGAEKPSESDKKYFRYKRIVDWVMGQTEFSIDDAKSAADDERPVFVTRVVKDLERSGYLVRETQQSSRYRWNPGKPFSATKWLDDKLFGTQIKESPEQDRPRERLLAHGAEKLSNAELIAILIRSGRPVSQRSWAVKRSLAYFNDASRSYRTRDELN